MTSPFFIFRILISQIFLFLLNKFKSIPIAAINTNISKPGIPFSLSPLLPSSSPLLSDGILAAVVPTKSVNGSFSAGISVSVILIVYVPAAASLIVTDFCFVPSPVKEFPSGVFMLRLK